MVRISVHPDDNRLRMVELTPAGHVELKEQNRRADVRTADLLTGLDARQRTELTEAMATARRLLRLAAITVERVDGAAPDARACLEAYAADLTARFGSFTASDLVGPAEVSGTTGAFFVAYEEGRPVGCGGLRTLEPGVGELKHVWVHPDARRLGLARRLLEQAGARGGRARPEPAAPGHERVTHRGAGDVPGVRVPRDPGLRRPRLRRPLVREAARAVGAAPLTTGRAGPAPRRAARRGPGRRRGAGARPCPAGAGAGAAAPRRRPGRGSPPAAAPRRC